MEVGDNEEPGFHSFSHGFAQTVYEHEEAGGGGYCHQIVMERNDNDVRIDEHRNQSACFQATGRIHQHHVDARIIVELFHQGGHAVLVSGFVSDHFIKHVLLAVLLNVRLAAFDDGVLEVAIDHNDTDTHRHQVIGEGYAKGGLSYTSLLVGECHYDR